MYSHPLSFFSFLFYDKAPTEIYTLSLHDALPICQPGDWRVEDGILIGRGPKVSHLYTERDDYEDFHFRIEAKRSEEHTSELQSRVDLVCRLLLEKKKEKSNKIKDYRTEQR